MDYFTFDHSSASTSPTLSSEAPDLATIDSPPDLPFLLDQQIILDPSLFGSDMSFQWEQNIPQAWHTFNVQPQISTKSQGPTNAHAPSQSRTKKDSDDETKFHKRRAQNRTSQRLFRERKLNYIKGIEAQLEELNERYQDLLVLYNNQSKDNVALLSRIASLTAKMANDR